MDVVQGTVRLAPAARSTDPVDDQRVAGGTTRHAILHGFRLDKNNQLTDCIRHDEDPHHATAGQFRHMARPGSARASAVVRHACVWPGEHAPNHAPPTGGLTSTKDASEDASRLR